MQILILISINFHVFAELQKAKSKAQSSNNLKEEASLCNQLGEVYAKTGEKENEALKDLKLWQL